MNLSESQCKAILELGGCLEADEYIPQRVLNDLLSYGLIYWHTAGEADLTSAGEEIYEELTGSVGTKIA